MPSVYTQLKSITYSHLMGKTIGEFPVNKTLRITFTILAIVGILVLLGFFFGRSGWNMTGLTQGGVTNTPYGMMNGMGPGMMGGGFTNGFVTFGWPGMILGWIVNIGLIVGAIFLVVWLVNRVSVPGQGSASAGLFSAPREILQTRYARGEITREQYLEMLGDVN